MARPSRTILSANDPTFLWKVILRALALVLALVGIAITAWALTHYTGAPNAYADDSDTLGSDPDTYGASDVYFPDLIYLPWTFITLGLSVIWNTANLAVLFSRNRPIYPGANVGCDLILWLALLFTGSWAVIGGTTYFDDYTGQEFGSDGIEGSSFSNSTGTWYQLYNGTLVNETVADCGGFSTCAAEQQFSNTLQHKGVVILVAAAMSLIVL